MLHLSCQERELDKRHVSLEIGTLRAGESVKEYVPKRLQPPRARFCKPNPHKLLISQTLHVYPAYLSSVRSEYEIVEARVDIVKSYPDLRWSEAMGDRFEFARSTTCR